MPFRVYLVEPPTLLDDLLEDSARIFHHHCAIIQRIFHEAWLTTFGKRLGQEQLEHADDRPAAVEARVLRRLRSCRQALREKQRELVREEEEAREQRDRAIRAYVATHPQEVVAA